jgi:hypothetical protein
MKTRLALALLSALIACGFTTIATSVAFAGDDAASDGSGTGGGSGTTDGSGTGGGSGQTGENRTGAEGGTH